MGQIFGADEGDVASFCHWNSSTGWWAAGAGGLLSAAGQLLNAVAVLKLPVSTCGSDHSYTASQSRRACTCALGNAVQAVAQTRCSVTWTADTNTLCPWPVLPTHRERGAKALEERLGMKTSGQQGSGAAPGGLDLESGEGEDAHAHA